MKNKNQYNKLKQLSDQHEVPFNPAAWDKMESLLDDRTPPESPPPGASFFKPKNIIAMLILLLTLAWLFLPMGEQSADTELAKTTATTTKQDNYIFEKNDTTKQKTTKLTNDDLDKKPKTGGLTTNEKLTEPNDLNAQNISKISPIGGLWKSYPFDYLTNQTIKTSHLFNNIFTEQFPSDGLFVGEIKKELATYNQFRGEEKVYLHFDRTMLKPGESLWFSVYVRNANTLLPSEKSDIVYVEFIAPNGGILKQLKLVAKNGVAKGDIQTSAEMAGGIYKIKAYTNWQRNFDSYFERKITLQKTVLPHLRMKLDFEKEAYGASDEVVVKLDLNSLENTPLSYFAFDYEVSLDGDIFSQQKSKTDNNGHAKLKFHLPKDLKTNDGLVNVLLNYQGQNESISRSIPIILGKMDIQFFPEGGDLVAGFEQEVAFKALNEFGKPADVEGVVLSANGVEVASFKSYHQGMGAFDFQPLYGGKYFAKITQPQNIKGTYPLPVVLENGNTMHLANVDNEELSVEIQNADNQRLTLVLQSQGKVINTISTSAKSGKHLLKIPIKNAPIGIAQLTLFDDKKRPHAERLVFLNKNKTIKIQVTTDKNKYTPREKVSLKIEAKDEDGNPVQGQFSVGVTDDKLLSFADDKQGGMLAYLLLESDLKGAIEEPNFYFEAKEKHLDKDQNLALNYLMMTNGWRRFTWKDQVDPIAEMAYPNEKAIITGTVVDIFGQVISGAVVGVEGLVETVLTDEHGQFFFKNIPLQDGKKLKGNYAKLVASKDGVGKIMVNDFGKYVVKINNSPNQNFMIKVIPTDGVRQIRGRVVDETGEALIGASVYFENTKVGVAADIHGDYIINNVPLGTHVLKIAYTGYHSVSEPVTITDDAILLANVVLGEGVALDEVVVTGLGIRRTKKSLSLSVSPPDILPEIDVVDFRVPLIKQDATSSGKTVTSDQIKKLPTRNINAVAAAVAGASTTDEGEAISMKGSRSDNIHYYVDGIRISENISQEENLAELEDLLTGTPARFENKEEMEEQEMDEIQIMDLELDISKNFKNGFYQARDFYKPKYTPKKKTKVRKDFRPTIFWNAMIETDANGVAKFEFYNSDELTTFRATVEGISSAGKVGSSTHTYFTQMPFGMRTKFPTQVLTGDKLTIPVTISNNTDAKMEVKLDALVPQGFEFLGKNTDTYSVGSQEVKTIYLPFEIKSKTGEHGIAIKIAANGMEDIFSKKIKVLERGFPVNMMFSGSDLEEEFEVEVSDMIGGNAEAIFTIYPSVLNDLSKGMERMVRQPTGCFEQTSSANYPNLLVLDYLKNTNTLDQDLEKQLYDILEKGYQRLLTFEVESGGFDWYGNPPAHEGLTAYGLMQFKDMQRVHRVEQGVIDRTAEWLLTRRDGQGGWKNSKRALHTWGAKDAASNAYITWAMTEAGYGKDVKKEIEKTYQDAQKTKDAYVMALAIHALYNVNDKRANVLLRNLLKLQDADGSWDAKTTMTHSGGKSRKVETTALASLAIIKVKKGLTQLEKAMKFIAQSKTDYGFGSTQSTVLGMKALVEHAKFSTQIKTDGVVSLMIDGRKVAEQAFTKGQETAIIFDKISPFFTEGKHEVKVLFGKTKTALPYDLSVNYSTVLPKNDAACKVELTTQLQKNTGKTGENIRLTILLQNKTNEALPNTIAKIGIPAGLNLQPWQLKELQEKSVFDYYEIMDGYLVLHYRGIAAAATQTVHLDLKVDLSGIFEAPASVAYLYYTNEFRNWSKPEKVQIGD